jgi:hypothetical protein
MGVGVDTLDVDIVGCQIGYGLPRGNVLVMPRCGDGLTGVISACVWLVCLGACNRTSKSSRHLLLGCLI